MQRRIQSLPAQLANQIAAGEVVERPSSVVKELLENSIDAGADQIELEVEQGGTRLIRVVDNGSGIVRDDLLLAVAPHATSKIYTQQELEQIASLGFRGEALASIASVSRFSIASRADGAEQGWELNCSGADTGELLPNAIPRGTRVEVRELFHNIPARRKFLRSERTEFLHLEEVVKRLALSRFDIAFTLIHNGRQVLRLRQAHDETQRARRVSDILGRSFIQQALELDFAAAGMRLNGWVARPEASRSQADNQYFYLNGRMIRDKLINHAVRQAHQSVLEPGRHPAYALFLEVDPTQVDVNVHPTKHEVRFRESRLVHDFVFRALLNALAGEQQATSELELLHAQAVGEGDSGASPAVESSAWRPSGPTLGRVAEQNAFYRQALAADRDPTPAVMPDAPLGRARAILHQHYLLAETASGPILLDLTAARIRLLSEHLQQMIGAGDVRSQPLLIPQTIPLEEAEMERLLGAGEILTDLGFELERLGEEAMVLRRIPALLRGMEASEVVAILLDSVPAKGKAARHDPIQQAMVARSVALTPVTELAEAERILRQLEQLPDGWDAFCRPLSLQQLQQWFGGPTRGEP